VFHPMRGCRTALEAQRNVKTEFRRSPPETTGLLMVTHSEAQQTDVFSRDT
jgi:hypothetical protein